MSRKNDIPKEDLEMINKSFEANGPLETLEMNASGRVVKASKKVINDKSIRLENFSGRVLRHQKSICINGRGTIVIGSKGDKYDEIPIENRNLVKWFDGDFEPI